MPLLSLSRWASFVFVAAAAAALAGCSTTTGHAEARGAAAAQAATTSDSLAQTYWELVDWKTSDGTPLALSTQQGNPPISIAFIAEGRSYHVSGFSGCNTFNGTYSLQSRRLTITVPSPRRLSCPAAPLAELEKSYLSGLGNISSFTLDSAGAPHQMSLHLRNGDVMAFKRGPDVPTR